MTEIVKRGVGNPNWVKGVSAHPTGRVSGSQNKHTVWLKYVDPTFPQMLKVGIEMALEGNVPMLQLFLIRGLPKLPKDEFDERLIEAQIQMIEARTKQLLELEHKLDSVLKIVGTL